MEFVDISILYGFVFYFLVYVLLELCGVQWVNFCNFSVAVCFSETSEHSSTAQIRNT
jgi:hypothetical protein